MKYIKTVNGMKATHAKIIKPLTVAKEPDQEFTIHNSAFLAMEHKYL